MTEPLENLVKEIDDLVKSVVISLLTKPTYKTPGILLPLFEDISTFPSVSGPTLKRLLLIRALVLWYGLLPWLRSSEASPPNLGDVWADLAGSFQSSLKQQRSKLQTLMGQVLMTQRDLYPNAMALLAALRTTLANRGTSHREGYLLEAVEIMIGLR